METSYEKKEEIFFLMNCDFTHNVSEKATY